MKIKIIFLLLTLILFFPNASASIQIKDLLMQSYKGTYSVLSYNGNLIILMIKEKFEDHVIVEKIQYSTPFKIPCNWQEVVTSKKGFPKINVLKISVQGIDTFILDTNSGLLKKIHSSSPLTKILQLKFDLIPQEKIKRTNGGSGPIWHPRVISEDKDLQNSETIALETFWPKDNSVLSEKRIEIRLPSLKELPFPIPIWIEIGEKIKIKSIEIGRNLQSPYNYNVDTQNK